MLNFNEFKKYCEENLVGVLPEEHKNVTITVNEVKKNNGKVLTALTIMPEGKNVAPNVYLDGFYKDYVSGANLDDIMEEIATLYMEHSDAPEDISDIVQKFRDVNFIKERVIMVVVNRAKNAELLSNVPHTIREDLALIYKVFLNDENEGTATITIHNEHLNYWNMTVEEIHELAVKNTKELLPVTVQSMNDVMREMLAKDGMPEEMMLMVLPPDIPADQQMYVISNNQKMHGAASMFYLDILSDLAEKIGTDLYILPSSIHECIAISSNVNTPDALAEMVTEINEGQVLPEERLSDNVYYFNAQEKTLTLAS